MGAVPSGLEIPWWKFCTILIDILIMVLETGDKFKEKMNMRLNKFQCSAMSMRFRIFFPEVF